MLNDTGFQRDGQLQSEGSDILSPGWPGLQVWTSIILRGGERNSRIELFLQFSLRRLLMC